MDQGKQGRFENLSDRIRDTTAKVNPAQRDVDRGGERLVGMVLKKRAESGNQMHRVVIDSEF